MERKKRRRYSAEFKAEAVRIVEQGRSANSLAKELGLASSTLLQWVEQARADGGKGSKGTLTTAERQELAQLRRENRRLREEREILKKAAAFFAKENEKE